AAARARSVVTGQEALVVERHRLAADRTDADLARRRQRAPLPWDRPTALALGRCLLLGHRDSLAERAPPVRSDPYGAVRRRRARSRSPSDRGDAIATARDAGSTPSRQRRIGTPDPVRGKHDADASAAVARVRDPSVRATVAVVVRVLLVVGVVVV